MNDDVDAGHPSNDSGGPDEPERLAVWQEDPDDWRSEFRSYLDDPE
jgi:hypothetical protein